LTSSPSEEIDFVREFGDAWKRVQRLWEKNLASLGLTLTELRILRVLSRDGPSPMAKVATELYMTPASITGLVDRLEGDGMVERERSLHDRRVVRVRATQKGKDSFDRGLRLYRRFMGRALQSLTEEEAAQLIRLLTKVGRAAESERP
jgi:MarR family transcriptional regulator, 2-MHQ and catechol-resistance regulon repressor